jgi:hypothetical protein
LACLPSWRFDCFFLDISPKSPNEYIFTQAFMYKRIQ